MRVTTTSTFLLAFVGLLATGCATGSRVAPSDSAPFTAPSPSASPEAGPASLPVSLVAALLAGRGMVMDASRFDVGTVPRGYPAQLIPDGPVRILGGMRVGDQITAVFADSTRNLAALAEDMFTRSGFARPPAEPGSGFMSSGGPYEFFCSDSAVASVHPMPGRAGIVRVEYRKFAGRVGCPMLRPRPSNRTALRLPELEPPPGVRLGRSGGGGGSDEVDTRAEATGARLDPAVLVSHFGAQLVAAGWRGSAPAIGERVAAQHFLAVDASGAAWDGALVAIGDTTKIRLTLRMRRSATP